MIKFIGRPAIDYLRSGLESGSCSLRPGEFVISWIDSFRGMISIFTHHLVAEAASLCDLFSPFEISLQDHCGLQVQRLGANLMSGEEESINTSAGTLSTPWVTLQFVLLLPTVFFSGAEQYVP